MDTYRFHIPDLLAQAAAGQLIHMPADQAHHARAVLHLDPKTHVTLFDGNGASALGEIAYPNKRDAAAHILDGIHVEALPPRALTLATAVPKGDRAEWLVEQASQLNVTRIRWLDCDRGVVKPRENGGKIDKWRRLAIESAKQCGRNRILQIDDLAPLEKTLQIAATQNQKILWLEPRHGTPVNAILQNLPLAPTLALIGPEGGWSPRETTLLQSAAENAQLHRVSLGPTILRIETACAAIAAILMATN